MLNLDPLKLQLQKQTQARAIPPAPESHWLHGPGAPASRFSDLVLSSKNDRSYNFSIY